MSEARSRSADARREPRHDYVQFAWIRGDGHPPVQGLARSVDISESGVGLVMTEPVPLDRELIVELQQGSELCQARGRVMHCRARPNGGFRIGLRLTQPFEVVSPVESQQEE